MGKLKPITIAKKLYDKKIAEYKWSESHQHPSSRHILLNQIKALSVIWDFEFPVVLQWQLLLHQKCNLETTGQECSPHQSVDYYVRLFSADFVDGVSKSKYGYIDGKRMEL